MNGLSNKEECRYSVLSAIHDDGLDVSEALDQLYEHHIGPLEEEVKWLRTDNECLKAANEQLILENDRTAI